MCARSPAGMPGRRDRVEEPLAALPLHARRYGARARARQVRDARVPEVQEVLRGQLPHRAVVDREAGRGATAPAEADEGLLAAVERDDLVLVEVDADGDHRIDALAGEEEVEHAGAAGSGLGQVVEREVVARAQQRALDALEHLAEEPAVHERDDHADVLRSSGHEARGIGRRDVPDLGGGRLDAAAGVVGDVAAAREGAGGGGLRDTRETGDIADGGHQRLPPSGCSDASVVRRGANVEPFPECRPTVPSGVDRRQWERSPADSRRNAVRYPNRDLRSLVRNRPVVLPWRLEPVPGFPCTTLNEEMT